MKGCTDVIVLDGNMKNRRDVCSATEAGYAKYAGLSWKVKTGCPNTPQPQSRYCAVHRPTAFTPQGDDGPTKYQDQVAYITCKKTTRQTTFYEVIIC